MKSALLILVFLVCGLLIAVQSSKVREQKSFQNDICLPANIYMLSDVQNDIFVEPFIKRWRPFQDVVRFSGTAKYTRRLQRVASIDGPEDGTSVVASLINQDNFDTIKSVTSNIVIGEKGKGENTVTVSIIGDSYTQGAFFKDALLVKNYVPHIKMIGLRDVIGQPGQADEGRGGWTLNKYFTVTNKRTDAYNGFWQPDGVHKYWGATAFWQLANAIRLHPETKWTFSESYNAGRFGTQSLKFDEASGYKKNPMKNDIMFDNLLDAYVQYNGEKWQKVSYEDFNWDVDYGKYLSMWQLESPSILVEFLGLNDFRGAADPSGIDFSLWNKQMEKLIDSYHTADPNGKFVLMIPCSSCGILDNEAGDFTTKQNACMWELRRNIIENFDRREAESIYIVDAGIAIDNVNGYNFSIDSAFTNPYSEFQGDKRLPVQSGNPHPYINYPSMGISLAAFIQRYRK